MSCDSCKVDELIMEHPLIFWYVPAIDEYMNLCKECSDEKIDEKIDNTWFYE